MPSPHRRQRGPHAPSTRSLEPDLPLHIALAHLVVCAFPYNDQREPVQVFSTTFISDVLALVCREVYQVGDAPLTYAELCVEVDRLVKPEVASIARLNDKVRARGQAVAKESQEAQDDGAGWMQALCNSFENVSTGCVFLDHLDKELGERVSEDDDVELAENPEPVDRQSPLGLFMRRVLLTLRKLSFDETAHLSRQVRRWIGLWPQDSAYALMDPYASLMSTNRKGAMEDTAAKRLGILHRQVAASASGDYSGALASLRRFYDYQFPGSARGRHQHALLNLASFYLSTGGLDSAQEAINEAIRVARAEGDKPCLQHCMSLLHRLETVGPSSDTSASLRVEQTMITDSRLPKISSPMGELWALGAALDMGEPVHVAMQRVYLALGRYDRTRLRPQDKQIQGWATEHTFDEGAWHAAQAGLWNMAGSHTLAELHEDLALESAKVDGDARLTVLLARAEGLANKGEYEDALSLLTDYDTIEKMEIGSYKRWARALWAILRHQVVLSGDADALDILAILDPGDSMSLKGISHSAVQKEIQTSLKKAGKLRDANAPAHLILPLVLSAIHLSSQLSLWPLYRLGVVTFAEVLLSMEDQGMGPRAVKEVEKIWPALVGGGDEETLARAELVIGKATAEAAIDTNRAELLGLAREHLDRAAAGARKISSRSLVEQTEMLLSLVSSLQGDAHSASSAEQRWAASFESGRDPDKNKTRASEYGDRVRQIGKLVKLVGSKVATGWRDQEHGTDNI